MVEALEIMINPLVMTNIAMENGPFIVDFPIKTSMYKGFSMAILNKQMVRTRLPELSFEVLSHTLKETLVMRRSNFG